MTETQPAPAGPGVSADVAELDRALTRIAYLLTRNRRNGLTAAGVPLDRAAVTVLLELADSGAMRPGELAARLEVEAPHVTRQVQRLEKAGYAARGADPEDRRAQLIQLTPSGAAAAGRIREVGRSGVRAQHGAGHASVAFWRAAIKILAAVALFLLASGVVTVVQYMHHLR